MVGVTIMIIIILVIHLSSNHYDLLHLHNPHIFIAIFPCAQQVHSLLVQPVLLHQSMVPFSSLKLPTGT
jgi:hypothetical protein